MILYFHMREKVPAIKSSLTELLTFPMTSSLIFHENKSVLGHCETFINT